MIAQILPAAAVAVEARGDPAGVRLFPEEQAVVERAVEKRRLEFATGRDCARRALRALGFPPLAIPSGARGEPRWPAGVVGSITHCHGYRACAVARARDLATLGIDAEPNEPLPDGVLSTIAGPQELPHLRELTRAQPAVHWDRLLFSAKETVYKAWFPLTRHPLGFEDATLTFDADRRSFTASLSVPGPSPLGVCPQTLSGRWLVGDGLIITTIALSPPRVSDK
jgi:4'-phosphopantetheinyl transferase EntD